MGELIFLGFFFAILLSAVFVFSTKRGRGLLFGGKIVKTWDAIEGRRKIVTSRVKVHAVDAAPSVRFVGLELSATTMGGYQMIPISLPAKEALELARLLKEAAEYPSDDSKT